MPLENLSGDADQEHIAVGVQQALITQLAQLPGLTKVIARASTIRFKDSNGSPAQIGKALGVRAIVTGSFTRAGDRVQVAAQLVDAEAERQVWGDTYDRAFEDVAGLQRDVVVDIARAIELRLTPADRQRLAINATIRPETYEAYLRGMYEINNDQGSGLAYLQEAIDRDPGDPFAYAGLAKGYATLGHGPAAPGARGSARERRPSAR